MILYRTIAILFISFIVFFSIDIFAYKSKKSNGIVVDKNYKGEHTSVGTGTIFVNGKVGTTTNVNVDSEKFLVMVKILDEDIVVVDCSAKLYYKKEKGDILFFEYCTGFFTNIVYGVDGIK
jgi:hypothetical protein